MVATRQHPVKSDFEEIRAVRVAEIAAGTVVSGAMTVGAALGILRPMHQGSTASIVEIEVGFAGYSLV